MSLGKIVKGMVFGVPSAKKLRKPAPIQIEIVEPRPPTHREQVKAWMSGGPKPERLRRMEHNISEMFGGGGDVPSRSEIKSNPFDDGIRVKVKKKRYDVDEMFRGKL